MIKTATFYISIGTKNYNIHKEVYAMNAQLVTEKIEGRLKQNEITLKIHQLLKSSDTLGSENMLISMDAEKYLIVVGDLKQSSMGKTCLERYPVQFMYLTKEEQVYNTMHNFEYVEHSDLAYIPSIVGSNIVLMILRAMVENGEFEATVDMGDILFRLLKD